MAKLTLSEVQAVQTELNAIRYQRMRILKAVQRMLQTITKARGYTASVDEVLFEVNDSRSRSAGRTPVIYIVDNRVREIRHAGRTREMTWNVYLYVIVRDYEIEDFEDFIGDVEECLFDNNTLFGNISKLEIPNIITDQQMFNAIDGVFQAEIELEIEYIRCARSVR